MKVVCGVPLLLLGFVGLVGGAEEGCARWNPAPDDQVCCEQCKQGNHMVSECGPDPQTLCRRCTQCTGVQKVKQACTSRSDTVCDCVTGYRCGDPKCSFCYQVCGEGQQPVANSKQGTCQPCPPGTFNHKIHSQCVPWSTRCPQPEQKIVKSGTPVSDIVCDFVPDSRNGPVVTETPALRLEKTILPADTKYTGHTERMMVASLVLSPVFIVIFVVLAACNLIRWRKKRQQTITKEPATEKPTTVSMEVSRLVEQESSCCFPQQEQGSSLESVASLDSKVKLLSV